MELNKKIAIGVLLAGIVMYFSSKEEPKRTQAQLSAGDDMSFRTLSKVLMLGGGASLIYQSYTKKT